MTRGQLFHLLGWSSSAASLVQIIAVAAAGPIVALAKLPDPNASLHHHLLWHRHHNAKEVRILKCLGEDRTVDTLSHWSDVFQLYSKCRCADRCRKQMDKWWAVTERGTVSYWGRQTEDRLLGHQPFSKVHIILKIWKMIHVHPHLDKCAHTHTQ